MATTRMPEACATCSRQSSSAEPGRADERAEDDEHGAEAEHERRDAAQRLRHPAPRRADRRPTRRRRPPDRRARAAARTASRTRAHPRRTPLRASPGSLEPRELVVELLLEPVALGAGERGRRRIDGAPAARQQHRQAAAREQEHRRARARPARRSPSAACRPAPRSRTRPRACAWPSLRLSPRARSRPSSRRIWLACGELDWSRRVLQVGHISSVESCAIVQPCSGAAPGRNAPSAPAISAAAAIRTRRAASAGA